MKNQTVLILDFGGASSRLIARKVRALSIYCEVHPFKKAAKLIEDLAPQGIILSGNPSKNGELVDASIFEAGIPVLGIAYGAAQMLKACGGTVEDKEGKATVAQTVFDTASPIFKNIGHQSQTLLLPTHEVKELPNGFRISAKSQNCAVAACEYTAKRLFATMFYPESDQTDLGQAMLKSFLHDVCGCTGDWSMQDYIDATIADIKKQAGGGKVLLALSGGVDSTVCAALLGKALHKQLTCVFVDHGFMRKNEGDEIMQVFADWDINLLRINAQDRFIDAVAGVTDPEKKRKIIGEQFIRVFEEQARLINAEHLAQGTIYPDVIESGEDDSKVVKSHHNVGGMPLNIEFKSIIEPLRMLFKDEVREIGTRLGIDEKTVMRQPFPGPGLAVRVVGEITREKLDLLREADAVVREEIYNAGLFRSINQYFAIITPIKSTGVTHGARTYDYTVAIRAIKTTDFMAAEIAQIDYQTLGRMAQRIAAIEGINRVVYDITTKPPATIEWE